MKQKLWILSLSLLSVLFLPLLHHACFDGCDWVFGSAWHIAWGGFFGGLFWLWMIGNNPIGVSMLVLYLMCFYSLGYVLFRTLLRRGFSWKPLLASSLFIMVTGLLLDKTVAPALQNVREAYTALARCEEPLGPGSTYIWKEHCIISVAGSYGAKYCKAIEHDLWRKECFDAVMGKKSAAYSYRNLHDDIAKTITGREVAKITQEEFFNTINVLFDAHKSHLLNEWDTFTDPALCQTIENDEIVLPNPAIKREAIARCYKIIETNLAGLAVNNGVAAAQDTSSDAAQALRLVISVEQPSYHADDLPTTRYPDNTEAVISVTGSIQNISEQDHWIYDVETTANPTYHLAGPTGQPVEIAYPIADPGPLRKEDFVLIKAGESFPKRFEVSFWTGDAVAPGSYTLSITYQVGLNWYVDDETGARVDVNAWTGTLRSNEIQFEVRQ